MAKEWKNFKKKVTFAITRIMFWVTEVFWMLCHSLLYCYLTFYSLLVTWCTTSLTFNNCTLCPHCIYVFCIYPRTNSDLCHLQHKLIGFHNPDEKCLLRGWTGSLNKAVCASSLKGSYLFFIILHKLQRNYDRKCYEVVVEIIYWHLWCSVCDCVTISTDSTIISTHVNVNNNLKMHHPLHVLLRSLTPSSPVMPRGFILFICPWYARLFLSDSSGHLSTLRWLYYAGLYMLKSPNTWTKVPVLAYFVGAAAATPTKHTRTGTFIHMLGEFSIYSCA
jgi:hypothetical protein